MICQRQEDFSRHWWFPKSSWLLVSPISGSVLQDLLSNSISCSKDVEQISPHCQGMRRLFPLIPDVKWCKGSRFGSVPLLLPRKSLPWLWFSSQAMNKGSLHNSMNPFLCFECKFRECQTVRPLTEQIFNSAVQRDHGHMYLPCSVSWRAFLGCTLSMCLGFLARGWVRRGWFYWITLPLCQDLTKLCPNSDTAGSIVDKNYPAVKAQTLHCSPTPFSSSLFLKQWRCVLPVYFN